MRLLATARFADTVVRLPQLARINPDGLPEVAFVGRSNAGKSTCINLICNRRRLAFASRTPGRTQALNLFALGPETTGARPVGYLVDTPGYGFAAAAPAAKKAWQSLAGDYIRQRAPLAGVVLMIDIRRELTELDRELLGWTPSTLPMVLVLTKADKLSRTEARAVVRRLAADPAIKARTGPTLLLLFSMLSRIGIDPLQAAIASLVAGTLDDWTRLDRADPALPTLIGADAPPAARAVESQPTEPAE